MFGAAKDRPLRPGGKEARVARMPQKGGLEEITMNVTSMMMFGSAFVTCCKDMWERTFRETCFQCYGHKCCVCSGCRGKGVLSRNDFYKPTPGDPLSSSEPQDWMVDDEWRYDYDDQYLCPTCDGVGTQSCPKCKGRGFQWNAFPSWNHIVANTVLEDFGVKMRDMQDTRSRSLNTVLTVSSINDRVKMMSMLVRKHATDLKDTIERDQRFYAMLKRNLPTDAKGRPVDNKGRVIKLRLPWKQMAKLEGLERSLKRAGYMTSLMAHNLEGHDEGITPGGGHKYFWSEMPGTLRQKVEEFGRQERIKEACALVDGIADAPPGSSYVDALKSRENSKYRWYSDVVLDWFLPLKDRMEYELMRLTVGAPDVPDHIAEQTRLLNGAGSLKAIKVGRGGLYHPPGRNKVPIQFGRDGASWDDFEHNDEPDDDEEMMWYYGEDNDMMKWSADHEYYLRQQRLEWEEALRGVHEEEAKGVVEELEFRDAYELWEERVLAAKKAGRRVSEGDLWEDVVEETGLKLVTVPEDRVEPVPPGAGMTQLQWSNLDRLERHAIKYAMKIKARKIADGEVDEDDGEAERRMRRRRRGDKGGGLAGFFRGFGRKGSDSDSDSDGDAGGARQARATKPAVGRLGADGLLKDLDKKGSGKSQPGAPPARAGPGGKKSSGEVPAAATPGPSAKGAAAPPPAEAEASEPPADVAAPKKKKRVKKAAAPPAASITLALQRWIDGEDQGECGANAAGEQALFHIGFLGGWPTPWDASCNPWGRGAAPARSGRRPSP